jgi:hypothetical protein
MSGSPRIGEACGLETRAARKFLKKPRNPDN